MVCVYRLLAALLFTLFPMAVEESDYLVNQNSRNIFTKIAKKAINNKARLVDFAEKVAGKTVAKNINKFFTPITKALKPLLEGTLF